MAKAKLKTQKTAASVPAFIDSITDEKRRSDCRILADLMQKATGSEGKMWGASIVGFGDFHYKYGSGREADWFPIGFSPRKQALTLYFIPGIERYSAILGRLGPHKTGKGCLYIRNLADIDIDVLRDLITASIHDARNLKVGR